MTERRVPAQPHIATSKAWEWFEAREHEMTAERRERIFLALAEMEVELWKLDTSKAVRLDGGKTSR